MIESRAFRVAIVNESEPASVKRIKKGVTILAFQGDTHSEKQTSRLAKAIQSWPGRVGIEEIRFDEACRGQKVEILNLFPDVRELSIPTSAVSSLEDLKSLGSLKGLHLFSNRQRFAISSIGDLGIRAFRATLKTPLDLGPLARCSTLRTLSIVGWKDQDLRVISQVPLKHLRLVGGSLREASGIKDREYHYVQFLLCPSLSSLGPFSTRSLTISGCNKLNLESIALVQGIQFLEIRSKYISRLEFIRNCTSLKSLELEGSRKLDPKSLLDIAANKNLQKVSLPIRDRGTLESLTRENPQLIVSSPKGYFAEGHEVDSRAWEMLSRKLTTELHGPMDDWDSLDNP
jgi:hypothetical protein